MSWNLIETILVDYDFKDDHKDNKRFAIYKTLGFFSLKIYIFFNQKQ